MLRDDIEIINQVEDRRYNRDGSREQFVRVEFFVGKHGPFVERFPRDGYTAQLRDTRLNEFANEVRTA